MADARRNPPPRAAHFSSLPRFVTQPPRARHNAPLPALQSRCLGHCVAASPPRSQGQRSRRRGWLHAGQASRVSCDRPVPSTLVGLCFNGMAGDHVATECHFPSPCLHCRCTGHRARDCKCGRSPVRLPAHGRGAPRPRLMRPAHQPSPSSTVSSRSCSTDRETSVPPVCRPHFGSPQHAPEPVGEPTVPPGPPSPSPSPPTSPPPRLPSTHPVSEIVVIPRSAPINSVDE